MTIRNQTIRVYRGDTLKVTIALTTADGSPVDPSQSSDIRWNMAQTLYDEPLLSRSPGAGMDVAPEGISFTLLSGDTDLRPGAYYHELKVFDGDDVSTVTTGAFIIKPAMAVSTTVSSVRASQSVNLSGRFTASAVSLRAKG